MSKEKHLQRVNTLKGKIANFSTYTDAWFLVDWLNGTADAKNAIQLPRGEWAPKREIAERVRKLHSDRRKLRSDRKRVLRLISALKEADAIATEGRDREKFDALAKEIRVLIKPLARLRWQLVPAVATAKGYAGCRLEQVPGDNLRYALLTVARLSPHGLDWVRECSCGKWFVGYNRRSRFHAAECKRAFEAAQRKTPEGREKWREYMRRLRTMKRRRTNLRKRRR